MIFNKETIDKLISNSFEIDCIDICLTQKTDKNPIIYKGPGTIYQDEHGVLQLKLYSKINELTQEFSRLLKYFPPGKFIAEDNYFTLNAIDMNGNEWRADNIWISTSGSIPTSSLVVKSKLEKVEAIKQIDTRPNTEQNYLFIIVPGQYKIPCNQSDNLPNGGWRRNRAVFLVNKIDFELRQLDNYLIIKANAKPENLDKDTYIKLIEALSIITGRIVRPVVINNIQKGLDTLEIKSVDDSFANYESPCPFKHSTPANFESFTCFVEKYLINIDDPFSDLFGFWHKINRAWQAGIENASLSLGVAIEGIVKTYFREQGLPDDEIIKQAKIAKRILECLKSIGLGQRIIKRLLGSIEGLLNNTSPKSVLSKIAQDGLLHKDMPNAWGKLRNKAAHPDKTNQDRSAKQKDIDRFYTCIALFYHLLFIIIEYEGSYTDFSESGWPEKKFQLNNK